MTWWGARWLVQEPSQTGINSLPHRVTITSVFDIPFASISLYKIAAFLVSSRIHPCDAGLPSLLVTVVP